MKISVIYIFLFSFLFSGSPSMAQVSKDTIPAIKTNDVLISYELNISTRKQNGLAESYNGAIKTIFINDNRARLRLVSLMRVQSIFYSTESEDAEVVIVKESGKDSYKKKVTKQEWAIMNSKYDGARYIFEEDSIVVLDYNCKKAIVHLKDGKDITAFYTTQLNNDLFSKVEPAFAGLPGIVLKYEYANRHAKFTYTANSISLSPTDPEIYKTP